MPSCCPPGALGAFKNDLKPKGKMEVLSAKGLRDMPCYIIGGSNEQQPERVILVFTDVFGIDGGNQKVFCDILQESMGEDTQVWMPDVFRGKPVLRDLGRDWLTFSPFTLYPQMIGKRFVMSSSSLEKDFEQIIQPNVKKETGCQSVGMVGFCFGAWLASRYLALDNEKSDNFLSCAVQIHPSWQPEVLYANQKPKSSRTELALAERTKTKPLLLLPAKQDVDLKPDSPIVQLLAEQRSTTPEELSIEFPDMNHGFMARGDSSDPQTREAQEKVFELSVEFLNKHLVERKNSDVAVPEAALGEMSEKSEISC